MGPLFVVLLHPLRTDLDRGKDATLTSHRPSNVDDGEIFRGIVDVMLKLSREPPVIWPVHPRSRKMLERLDLTSGIERNRGFRLIPPIGYLDMLILNRSARMIMTDSGGLQEEATVLGVPCITLRENTERPVTVKAGANVVVGNRPGAIRSAVSSVMNEIGRRLIRIPQRWDGMASARIVDVLLHSRFWS